MSGTLLDHVQPVACRGVILTGLLMLVTRLGKPAHDLSVELGPMEDEGDEPDLLSFIRDQVTKLKSIYAGKCSMHDALEGEGDDLQLLTKLGLYIKHIEETVIQPLEGMKSGGKREERAREIGQDFSAIVRAADIDLQDADRRFAQTLNIPGPEEICSCTVISMDMARYTATAVERQRSGGVEAVYALNADIQSQLERAISEEGLETTHVPVLHIGDGALIYCQTEPAKAVALARRFQQGNIAAAGTMRFRIGIATGEVCLSRRHNAAGMLLGFSAAGVSIIDAVRLQTACAEDGVLVDESTWKELGPAERQDFRQRPHVRPKKQDGRSIPSWQWPATARVPRRHRTLLRLLCLIAASAALAAILRALMH